MAIYPVHYACITIHNYHVAVAACAVVNGYRASCELRVCMCGATPTYELMAEMMEKQVSLHDWNWI